MNKKLGVDPASGSLGNGISVATGVAYAHKADKQRNKVFTLVVMENVLGIMGNCIIHESSQIR